VGNLRVEYNVWSGSRLGLRLGQGNSIIHTLVVKRDPLLGPIALHGECDGAVVSVDACCYAVSARKGLFTFCLLVLLPVGVVSGCIWNWERTASWR
jgi:hypothetical protein